MKTLHLILCLVLPLAIWAQTFTPLNNDNQPQLQSNSKYSFFGGVHTPTGDLHLLVIFVRYPDQDFFPGDRMWPDVTEEGKLPSMATGPINQMFNQDPATIGIEGQPRNMSDYYYQMSQGKFRLTADVFPVQVPVEHIPLKGGNFFTRQSEMNKAAIEWISENYPDFDWSKYDNRSNLPQNAYDNSMSKPDSLLDYVVFMHRAPGSTGMGSSGSFKIPNSVYKVRSGHTGIACYVDTEHNWEYFKHEFAHNLYNAPHYMGANNVCGNRYYMQKGWGMMAFWHSPFFTANAWERWWLNWLDVQTISQDQLVTVKDLMLGNDAVRIPIPGSKEYLWIENHQKVNEWDDKIFFNRYEDRGDPRSAKGLYMYVVGEPGSKRENSTLSPFNKEGVNFIKMMNAEGNFDYEDVGKKVLGYYKNEYIAWKKGRSNPIAGQNDFQGIRWDKNGDGRILVRLSHGNKDRNAGEQQEVWAEIVNGEAEYNCNNTGDQEDAFTVGDEVGLSGIVPVLNYPMYEQKEQRLEPYILNGLSVKVLEQKEDGSYRLAVRFQDWEVRENVRWCGNLRLNTSSGTKPLEIGEKVELKLDLGGTPDRETKHEVTGTFTNPTLLQVEGRKIIVRRKGRLVIENHSVLELLDGAELVVEEKAELVIRAGGELKRGEGSKLTIRGKLIEE